MSVSWKDGFAKWAVVSTSYAGKELNHAAQFQYDPVSGVHVSLMVDEELPHKLESVVVRINQIGRVIVPLLTLKSVVHGSQFTEQEYKGEHCWELEPDQVRIEEPLVKADRLIIPFQYAEEFLRSSPFVQGPGEGEHQVTLKADNAYPIRDRILGDTATIELEIAYGSKWERNAGYVLTPKSAFVIDFDAPHDVAEVCRFGFSLRDLVDFLSYTSGDWVSYFVGLRGQCGMRWHGKTMRQSESESAKARGLFHLDLRDISSAFGNKATRVNELVISSRAWDEMLLLIRHPKLPFRERLLIAFRALESWSRERGRIAKGETFSQSLCAYRDYWNSLQIADLDRYLALVRNTRNDVAHLSKPDDKKLSEEDQYRAYFEIIAIARIAMMTDFGWDQSFISTYTERVRKRIESYHGKWDPTAYDIQPIKC
jgi:hypothetical protein